MKTNNTIDSAFEIEPMVFTPSAGEWPGRFIDMRMETEPKKNGTPRKDLILTIELDKPDASGQPAKVEQTFNMLQGGRGRSAFKKQMASWQKQPLTPVQLANLKASFVVNQRVIVKYKVDQLNHTVFDTYLPAAPAAAPAA